MLKVSGSSESAGFKKVFGIVCQSSSRLQSAMLEGRQLPLLQRPFLAMLLSTVPLESILDRTITVKQQARDSQPHL